MLKNTKMDGPLSFDGIAAIPSKDALVGILKLRGPDFFLNGDLNDPQKISSFLPFSSQKVLSVITI